MQPKRVPATCALLVRSGNSNRLHTLHEACAGCAHRMRSSYAHTWIHHSADACIHFCTHTLYRIHVRIARCGELDVRMAAVSGEYSYGGMLKQPCRNRPGGNFFFSGHKRAAEPPLVSRPSTGLHPSGPRSTDLAQRWPAPPLPSEAERSGPDARCWPLSVRLKMHCAAIGRGAGGHVCAVVLRRRIRATRHAGQALRIDLAHGSRVDGAHICLR